MEEDYWAKARETKTKMEKWKFTIPTTDAGANEKFQQFAENFATEAVTLGFTASDAEAINTAVGEYDAALMAANVAKDAAKNAVQFKDATLTSTSQFIRTWVDRVIVSPEGTSEIFGKLGITPYSSSAGPVVAPINVSATPNADGTCKIAWQRGSNVSGTVWVVESSTSGGEWEFEAISTSVKFVDTAANPGTPKSYRIRAQRNGVTSPPSPEAGIYGGGEGGTLQIAA